MVQGGGGNNGSWLKAGLIDEISLLLAPVADGTTGVPTVFRRGTGNGAVRGAAPVIVVGEKASRGRPLAALPGAKLANR